MEITGLYFRIMTGRKPIQDDLERCNCSERGTVGHTFCGWCFKCEKPVFGECNCQSRGLKPQYEP